MKNKDTQSDLQSTTYDFIIRVISVATTDLPHGHYILELEKGPQHVKTLQEAFSFWPSKQYLFKNKQQISLKLPNPKHADYFWSLYVINDQTMEYIDSIKFNLNDFYLPFTQELKEHSAEYSKILADKTNGNLIGQNWKKLKSKLKNYSFAKQNSNQTGNFKIKYSLDVKHQLDCISQKQAIHKLTSLTSKRSSDSRNDSSLPKNQPSFLTKNIATQAEAAGDQAQANSTIKVDQNTIKAEPGDSTHINVLTWDQTSEEVLSPASLSPKFTPYAQISQDKKPKTSYLFANNSGGLRSMILSDIIQKSNQGSISFVHSTDRSEVKPQQINETAEPTASRGKLSFQKKTTLNIEADQLQSHVIRRTNTLELVKTPEQSVQLKEQNQQVNQQQINQFERSPETSIVNEIVAPQQARQSSTEQQKPLQIKTDHRGWTIKSIVLLFVVVVLLGFTGLFVYPHRHRLLKNLNKNIFSSSPKPTKQTKSKTKSKY